METKINPEESVPDGVDVAPAEGGSDDTPAESADIQPAETLSLDDLRKAFNRPFKTVEEALKSIEDTKSYTGKVGKYKPILDSFEEKMGEQKTISLLNSLINMEEQQQTAPEVKDNPAAEDVMSLKKEINDIKFYSKNPEYEPYKDLIEKFGEDPAEVVKDEKFQDYFTKIKTQAETESAKSVLHSNPRIKQSTDKLSQAQESLKNGDTVGAADNAVDAVLDAYEMK